MLAIGRMLPRQIEYSIVVSVVVVVGVAVVVVWNTSRRSSRSGSLVKLDG